MFISCVSVVCVCARHTDFMCVSLYVSRSYLFRVSCGHCPCVFLLLCVSVFTLGVPFVCHGHIYFEYLCFFVSVMSISCVIALVCSSHIYFARAYGCVFWPCLLQVCTFVCHGHIYPARVCFCLFHSCLLHVHSCETNVKRNKRGYVHVRKSVRIKRMNVHSCKTSESAKSHEGTFIH